MLRHRYYRYDDGPDNFAIGMAAIILIPFWLAVLFLTFLFSPTAGTFLLVYLVGSLILNSL